MVNETLIATLETLTQGVIASKPEYFLVEIWIKPTNNVKVYLDADTGVNVGDLSKFNRSLYAQIEEAGLFPDGNFSLEVSSPGVDQPLKWHRQYVKNKGRKVEVSLLDGTTTEGTLQEVKEDCIIIITVTGKGKKAETKEQEISFSNIKSTRVQIVF